MDNRNKDPVLSNPEYGLIRDALVAHLSRLEDSLIKLKGFDLDVTHDEARKNLQLQQARSIAVKNKINKYLNQEDNGNSFKTPFTKNEESICYA